MQCTFMFITIASQIDFANLRQIWAKIPCGAGYLQASFFRTRRDGAANKKDPLFGSSAVAFNKEMLLLVMKDVGRGEVPGQ